MESIDDALAGLPQPEHDALQRVIDIARRVAPHAVDGVSYGVPALKVAGKPLIGVSASAHHLSIFPFSPAAIDLSLIHISEPTRLGMISYAVFCLKKKRIVAEYIRGI